MYKNIWLICIDCSLHQRSSYSLRLLSVGLLELMSPVPGYGHSLSDVKAVLRQSLRLCTLIRSEDYLKLVSRCVTDIEVCMFKAQVFALFVFIASDDL